jgi:hypothetical protein
MAGPENIHLCFEARTEVEVLASEAGEILFWSEVDIEAAADFDDPAVVAADFPVVEV